MCKFSAFSLYYLFTYLNVKMMEDLDASEHTGSSWSIQTSCEYVSETQQSMFFKELKTPPIKMMC